MPYYPTRKLTILAMDPSVTVRRKLLRTEIEIPNEPLERGPAGHRVRVIDYDSTAGVMYPPALLPPGLNSASDRPRDPFQDVPDEKLLADPVFHALMTYGIIMKILARFEFALGRRISWGFGGHQIQVAPHAFADANAFYADRAQGLFFGYFPGLDGKRRIFSCLSHEVVAHETARTAGRPARALHGPLVAATGGIPRGVRRYRRNALHLLRTERGGENGRSRHAGCQRTLRPPGQPDAGKTAQLGAAGAGSGDGLGIVGNSRPGSAPVRHPFPGQRPSDLRQI